MSVMDRCREGKSPYRVFRDKLAFSKQKTVQFDCLLLAAQISDRITAFQEFVPYGTLLILPNI